MHIKKYCLSVPPQQQGKVEFSILVLLFFMETEILTRQKKKYQTDHLFESYFHDDVSVDICMQHHVEQCWSMFTLQGFLT